LIETMTPRESFEFAAKLRTNISLADVPKKA